MANVNRYLNKPVDLQPAHLMKLWRAKPILFMEDQFDVKLDVWQEDCVELYQNNQRLALIASKGPGKAQPVETKVITPKGEVRIGDIRPGDEVLGENGLPTKVTSIHPQGIKSNYKVTFDDGTFTYCCDEHLWKVRGVTEKRKKTWAVKSLREIMDAGIVKNQGSQKYYPWQIPKQGKAFFPHKRLPIDPYVMGFFLGDGSRTSGIISSEDAGIVSEFERLGYSCSIRKYAGKCTAVYIKGLKPKLRKLNLLNKYSYEKRIPEVFKYVSITQRIELLKGLMDSDGTIDKRDSSCEFSTTSYGLAEDIQWLIRSLGGKSMAIKTKRSFFKGVRHRDCYRVRVSTDFNPFKLWRKAKHWKCPKQDRYFCRTIKKVEKVKDTEMVCISVKDTNRCYLTNDFIVTHNTFLLAMLGWHYFMTNHQPKIAALSITKDHLKSNLWAELLMWREHSELCKKSTNDGAERITLKGHEGYSFIDARSFPKSADQHQQASALAGLHAKNVGFLIDEAGTIPDSVLATADAALTQEVSDTTNAKLMVTANPEVPSGLIYNAAMGKTVQKWATYRISGDPDDPKRAPKVDINWAREQIQQFGPDDPWVLINVFGKYPKQAADMLLTDAEVQEAMQRQVKEEDVVNAQSRMGIDVARGGVDRSAFAFRKGLKAYPIDTVGSHIHGPELAGITMTKHENKRIERVFVDDTGGFGSAVVDSLDMSAPTFDVTPIKYNAKAQDRRYFNKRTEMWVRMRDWVRKGGCLPNDPELAQELTMPKLFFHGGVFRLEEKDQIKKRLGKSPDKADALAQTFADEEQPSFFADHSEAFSDLGIDKDKQWEIYKRMGSNGGNHISDPNQLDSHSNPYYPKHRS